MTEQIEGQMSIFDYSDLVTWSGKTCLEHSAATTAKTSEPSLKKQRGSLTKMPLFLDLRRNGAIQEPSWETGGVLLGEYMMHSFGESPKDVSVSRLSQILEEKPHPKYCLSAKACQGILNRAERRGKELPQILREALIRQATPSKSEGGVEVDSKGKKAGKGALVQTELSGTLGVSQDQTLITKCLNGWDVQSKHVHPEDGVAETTGTVVGGTDGSEPTPINTMIATRYKALGRGTGLGIGEPGDAAYVLQKPYGISAYDSNAMKSSNPHSGIYEAETSRTLDLNGGSPACNQGGMAVVCLEGNGQRDSHKGDGYKESDIMYTLNTVEQHAICINERGETN